jgi:isopenicillin N synthase-like dioxygenase
MPRTLPILDLSSWREGDRASLVKIGAEVGAACRDVGFFYVVNHAVDDHLIARAFAQSHRFFALPLAERQALAIEKIGGNRGYSGILHEALDPQRGPDMKEAFNIGLEIAPDDPDLLSGQLSAPSTHGRTCRISAKRCSTTTTPAPRSAPGCIAHSPATSASTPAFSTTNSIARWRRSGSCTIRRPPRAPLRGRALAHTPTTAT